MRNFPVEVATQKADLPHAFSLDQEGPHAQLCAECAGFAQDPRHVAFEQMQRDQRETASSRSPIVRETGA